MISEEKFRASSRLNTNRAITKEVWGWKPPDTDELNRINVLLKNIANRVHSLRVAFLLNDETVNGRIRRAMASRKRAIEKAYQKGICAGRKKRRHA
jgi:hypothetical protein